MHWCPAVSPEYSFTKRKVVSMPDLFDKDPAFVYRDRKGRFATPEKAMADKAIEENKMLRLQVEKFRRAYLAAASMSSKYHRELVEIKYSVKNILKKGGAV